MITSVGVMYVGSDDIEKRKKKSTWEFKDSAIQTKPIVEMFSAQHNADRSQNTDHVLGLLLPLSPSESS